MVVINTDNNSGVEVNLPDTFNGGNDRDAEADAASTSHEEEEDGGGSFWIWRFWVWDSINQMTIVMAMAMLCLFILFGFATNSLSATAVKNNMSSTTAKAGKQTKSPTSKAGKATTVVQVCGGSFTNQKVVLSNDLDCGSFVDPQQDCAVTLDGPQAEIDCNDFKLSQEANPTSYGDGPFLYGICLNNGAKARNCNVQKFYNGIYVVDGGEVVNSDLSSNQVGIQAAFEVDSTLTIENT